MSTILFDKIVFGPIHSRRLGVSLGMNLLPTDGKLCSFNCIYCECGLNENHRTHSKLPTRTEVREALGQKLSSMKAEGIAPDVITFAGNGEPTIHPEFGGIIDDTVAIRDRFFPDAKIAVLSNSTMLHKEDNILKLDSVLDSRIRQIDVPNSPAFNFESLLKQLCRFNGNLIIQTMFLKGELNGESVNNMTEEEIAGWISALKQIRPKQVMIYTIDRETPVKALKKATKEELDAIAERARKEGFDVKYVCDVCGWEYDEEKEKIASTLDALWSGSGLSIARGMWAERCSGGIFRSVGLLYQRYRFVSGRSGGGFFSFITSGLFHVS